MEEIFNFLILKERDFFLSQNEDEQGNDFYSRTLNTYYGKLNLKIPRIRYAHSFRPALFPPRWKRFNKEYEEFVLACLANGYSKAYHTEIREDNRLQKVSVFTALGIDLDGYKHILGYWIMKGGKTLGFWQAVICPEI
ncbi:MAG: transposase [Desulfurococcaceae archaeon]